MTIDTNAITDARKARAIRGLEHVAPPEPFVFPARSGVGTSTLVTSNTVRLKGNELCVWPIVARGSAGAGVSVNGSSFGSFAVARPGDDVQVRVTSAGTAGATASVTVYAPGFRATFTVTA